MNQCGIYKISIGPYFYFGQSRNIYYRCHRHKSNLRNNCHGNSFMQNVYNKYQEFHYQVILECKEEELNLQESKIIEEFINNEYCLNLNKVDIDGSYKLSEETKRKIGNANRGKIRTLETKRKLSEASKNRKHSDETKKKMSENSGARNRTPEWTAKIALAKTGSKHSEESKQKMSETHKKLHENIEFYQERKKQWTKGIHSEESKAKQKEKMKEICATQDYKENMSKTHKNSKAVQAHISKLNENRKRKVCIVTIQEEILEFESVAEASRLTQINASTLRSYISKEINWPTKGSFSEKYKTGYYKEEKENVYSQEDSAANTG